MNARREFYVQPLSLYEHIQTKTKIKHLDVHKTQPWLLFSDKDNNIIIFDVANKKPIRAFTIQQYFQETVQIKSLKFFDINDRKYINNYDMNDYVRIKGISLHLRGSLIIITLEKYICFYSYILQNFIRVISQKDLDGKLPVKCELYNYLYVIIQTDDGCLNIWNLKDWNLVRTINKQYFNGKQCVYFTVISFENEEKSIACANKSGNIILIDISKKDITHTKIDTDKCEHDSQVLSIDFNPKTNILMSISKNEILLINIKNNKMYKKIQNFQFTKGSKIRGVTINLSNNFNQYSYFIYGKSSSLLLIDLNLDSIKSMKIDSKTVKNLISYSYELDKVIFQKVGDKPIKIYKASFLLNVVDYLALSTNKGVIILRFDPSNKSSIVADERAMDLIADPNNFVLYTLSNNQLVENIYQIEDPNKNRLLEQKEPVFSPVFNINKQSVVSLYQRTKIKFSHDFNYLACIDSYIESYTIFKVDLGDSLKSSFKVVKQGKGVSFEWCPFDNIFAVCQGKEVNLNSTTKGTDVKKASIIKFSQFILSVYKISQENDKATVIYEVDNLPCHRLFACHFLGFFSLAVQIENQSSSMNFKTSYTYTVSTKVEIVFYNWNEKKKIGLTLNEEPIQIVSTDDLEYMVICFSDRYVIYQLDCNSGTLNIKTINYYSVVDCLIYDSLVFVFLTTNGVYFHILTEENGYPFKCFKFSNEMNNYHLKISKKFKEKEILYNKKHFQQKLIGIYHNHLIISNCFGEATIREIEHVLFKIIYLVKQREFDKISESILTLERKFIHPLLAIFKFYFDNDEATLRKIFTTEMIEQFQLYKHLKCFIKDIGANRREINKVEVEKIMKKNMITAIMSHNIAEMSDIYSLCSNNKLAFEAKSAKCLDRETYIKTLLGKKNFFEAYVFDSSNNPEMGEKLLTKGFEMINSSK